MAPLSPRRVAAAVPRQFAPSARRYALPPALLAVPLSVLVPPVGLLCVAVALFVLWFFRDPDRTAPESGFVSPADGRVSVVRREGDRVRVGVFMNVTDVHVNRAPADADVESVTHRPGAHRPAFSKDSERNERVDVDCGEFEISLIAGAFARRIHPYVEEGTTLERGQRIGHIAFGSRADVLLPERFDATDLCVEKGQRVRAGETVVARQS
ncbi:protein sorting system archaetidylserine decarboxylase [Haloprofundus sp. MHR1]|uniref:protein sorting system archaetidylserine decarboxylase n=1 Tax=Haloprofundus sp. MHR1 TaxID=2572921 RepID=UPI0010BF19B8|nr:protein sorting system archaetidylserine decarboxylase [Haloprofundus sp. MHR1]QCJ46949.1 phosphatidylserine decarboxylase [Haloprofundus sp. MHR1]